MDGGAWVIVSALVAVVVIFAVIRGWVAELRSLFYQLFGLKSLASGMELLTGQEEQQPRSLSGCDAFLLPQILEDFPDFDVTMAKTYAQEYLREKLSPRELTIYNVVISQYLPSAAQKTIVFQAALSYPEGDRRIQKRYDLYYSYVHSGSSQTVAANCPNCGAVLGYGDKVCAYCGSRVVNVLGNTWEFTRLSES